MAENISPSSSSPHDDDGDRHIPTALALPAAGAPSIATRRFPTPCWSPEETSALIDAYKDKWYSLRRSNLRAKHWQEVADDVASRFPASPRKTDIQCRHKMEKLRMRYRAEIQRAASGRRFNSSWPHFQNMHSMEKGPNSIPSPPSFSSSDEEDNDYDCKDSVKGINNVHHRSNNQKFIHGYSEPVNYGATSGGRVKIPGGMQTPMGKAYNMFDEMASQNPNQQNPRFPNYFTSGNENRVSGDGFLGRNGFCKSKRSGEILKKKKKAKSSGLSEVAAAIQSMGEMFMRTEKVKMDTARHIEEIRMDMELKRTEMILESQQKIVEVFSKGICGRSVNKK